MGRGVGLELPFLVPVPALVPPGSCCIGPAEIERTAAGLGMIGGPGEINRINGGVAQNTAMLDIFIPAPSVIAVFLTNKN